MNNKQQAIYNKLTLGRTKSKQRLGVKQKLLSDEDIAIVVKQMFKDKYSKAVIAEVLSTEYADRLGTILKEGKSIQVTLKTSDLSNLLGKQSRSKK